MSRNVIFLGVLVLAGAVLVGILWYAGLFSDGGKQEATDERLTVAATIFPLADIARQIGGEHVAVQLILPPGASEHSDTLTPQRLQDLQRAQVIFHIGHGLDDQLVGKITGVVPSTRAVVVDAGIPLREFGEEEGEEREEAEEHAHDTGIDPHYWLSVPNAVEIATTTSRTLQELDPEHADIYEDNLQSYIGELALLEEELQETATTISRKQFIAMHDAWSYFADQYGLQLVATYEPIEGKEPSVADLARIRGIVEQFSVTTFYAEPQKASTAATNFMQEEFGLRILTLDPVGGREETDSYVNLMRSNMKQIVAGAQ